MTKIRFRETIRKLKMDTLLRECGTVIVGYSGGADSSCLLRFMKKWCDENGARIVCAHVNHMIRGAEADRDEGFCRREAEALGVEFRSCRIDVPGLSKSWKMGIEEAARIARYDYFAHLAAELTGSERGAVLATAHNADDNLESVLMNLMRGSGLHGMCGIAPIRDGHVIRPLICDSGENIRKWCDENGVGYVIDSTNTKADCMRNAVRHKIVPVMRELCASPEESATRMTALLRTDDAFLDRTARSYAADRTDIGRETLMSLDDAVASRVMIMLYDNAKTTDSTVSETQIDRILHLVREKSGHSEVSLAGGMRAVIERDSVSVVPCPTDAEKCGDVLFEYTGGVQVFENGLYRLTFSDKPIENAQKFEKKENIYKLSTLRSFSSDKINGRLKIRYKTDGDSYVYCGHTHKLKKLFTDAKLTEREKHLTPVLVDDDGIVWVAGFGTRDGARLTSGDGIHVLCERI